MTLSIVPVLFSLLASHSAASVPVTDLVVHVVDKDGKAVIGVQVGLFSQATFEGFPSIPNGCAISDEQGLARFVEVEKRVTPGEHMRYFVRLGVPAAQDIDAELDPRKLAEASPTLVLPECGSVLLHVPLKEKGEARLRRAPTDEQEQESFWYGEEPPAAQVVEGLARFEHVGLGIEIEYEVTGADLPTALTGKLHGPRSSGQAVEFTVPGLEGQPTLLVRLVDETFTPVSGVKLDYFITDSNGGDSSSGWLVPDAKGCARIWLEGEQAEAGARQLEISAETDPRAKQEFGDSRIEIDLPDEFASGQLDLGELMLAPPGSPQRFAREDDATLERRYEELLARMRKDRSYRRDALELLLCEFVRRGGPHWERYVAAKLREIRDPANEGLRGGPRELEWLTALRRVQGKADPLALVIQPESVLEATFPDTPVVAFALKNVDVGAESFAVTEGGSYRSGRFARCNVLALAPGGETLPPREWGSGMGGGMSGRETLAPGESLDGALALGDYVTLAQPGAYRVRIRYHDQEDIDSVADLRGMIVSTSEEFRVQIRPRRIELTQARLDELCGWIRAIDAQKPVALVSGHWHPGMGFNGAAVDPEDKLFRAGWEAVPALYAAMQDKAAEPERRAWVFGMLWNILGMENPGDEENFPALGKIQWIGKWPTSTEDAHQNFGEFGDWSPTGIDPRAQDVLAGRWAKRQGLIEVKIVP
jgi:hypothetical protein